MINSDARKRLEQTNCKCGHYRYAHNFGSDVCAIKGCKCKKYRKEK